VSGQLPLGVRLKDRAVFASFHAGPNASALTELQALLDGERGAVIVLWGARGAGKSHLLQAACNQIDKSVYLPLLQLGGLGPGSIDGAEERPCVCIDDLQCAAGDPDWERAIFRLYTELEARGTKLLMAAAQPPAALPIRLPDLASRLLASHTIALRALDETQQRAALQLRARLRGLELPEATAAYLQRRFRRDMHTLYGLLETLDLAALTAQRRLTVPFIRAVLDRSAT
jgi:DnaA family protein